MEEVFQLKSTELAYEFNITITNDGMLEAPEDFLVSLKHVTHSDNINIDPDMAIVNIVDDDGK